MNFLRPKGMTTTCTPIPMDIWERAKKRAHAQDESVRVILIRALQLFGTGHLKI